MKSAVDWQEAPTSGRVLQSPDPESQNGARHTDPGQLNRVGVPLVQLMRVSASAQALAVTKPVRAALQTSSVAPLQRCCPALQTATGVAMQAAAPVPLPLQVPAAPLAVRHAVPALAVRGMHWATPP